MFERAKEEFEAVLGALNQHKGSRNESKRMELKSEKPGLVIPSSFHQIVLEDGKKKPSLLRKAKEELKSLFQKEKPHHHHHHHHHKETHGMRDDINENTPVDEVKAPSVLERAKEEIEAVIETVHPKKSKTDGSDSDSGSSVRSRSDSPEKERAGFGCSLGKGLEKICSPWGDDKKD